MSDIAAQNLAFFQKTYHIKHPTHADFFTEAQKEYNAKRYGLAVKCLELCVQDAKNNTDVKELHLMGYAQMHCDNLQEALECFLACVRLGYEQDWQLVVDLQLRLDDAR
jgi:hypothetical protein